VTPGEHTIAIVKVGYNSWQRQVKVTAGTVTINIELEVATTPVTKEAEK